MKVIPSAVAAVLLTLSIATAARADGLPNVSDVRIEGDRLTWSAVDGATGYNVYLQGAYLTTVRGALALTLDQTGIYQVDPFDDDGNFGVSVNRERVFYEGGTDNRPYTWIVGDEAAYFTRRCLDVAAGDACEAKCPDGLGGNPPIPIGDATGGACSSSDTRHVQASVAPDGYTCTVSGFTARVEAQAVCLIR